MRAFQRHRVAAQVACTNGFCGTPRADHIARIGLWTAGVLVVAAVAFPYLIRAIAL